MNTETSKVADFELGNLMFGNSRGNYNFPDRELANNEYWEKLFNYMDNKYSDSDEFIYTERGNDLANPNFGEVLFTYMPYWWGDCTCGADDKNEILDAELRKNIFTKEEEDILDSYDDICNENCPAWKRELEGSKENEIPEEELDKLCTCGVRKANKILHEKKKALSSKLKIYTNLFDARAKSHSKDCKLVQHNFVYHPDKEDRLEIDWYKYPFRDSHTNRAISSEEFIEIVKDCLESIK